MEPKQLTCSKRIVDLPEDVVSRVLGTLDLLKDRVCAVSCNRQLAALGKSCTRLWEEVEFPEGINPGTASVWLAAKRSTVHKADLRRMSTAGAIFLLTALAGVVTEELSTCLSELSTFNPNMLQLPRLRKLRLTGGCDFGLGLEGSFSHLHHLSSLQLRELSWVTEEESLGGLTELRDLCFVAHNDCLGDSLRLAGLSQATGLTSLTLGLASADFDSEALPPALPLLEQFSVSGRAAAELASGLNWWGFPQLRSLTLSHGCHCDESLDLVPLVELPRLEVLDIGGCTLEDLPNLGLGMPVMARLQKLTVNDAWLSDNRAWLDSLPFVKTLHLTGEPYGLGGASDTHWEMLLESLVRALPSLETLEVDAYEVMAVGDEGTGLRRSFEFLLTMRPELDVFGPD